MTDYILLELFVLDGTYIALRDFEFYELMILKNETIRIKFNIFTDTKRDIVMDYWIKDLYIDCCWGNDFCVINELVPNIRKLTPDEVMIKDIIE